MRKALLVVTLVAASFAGGAAVNGPGLKWVKGLVSSRMRGGDPIPTLDLDDGPPRVQAEARPDPALPPDDVPSAPAPPLGANLPRAETPTPSRTAPNLTATPPTAADPQEPASASPPNPDPPAEVRPPAEPDPALPADPSAIAPPNAAPAPARAKEGAWGDAPGQAPATAVLPRPKDERGRTTDAAVAAAAVPAEPPALTSPTTTAPSDWASLRKRMRAMGVTKYWVEGSPGGAATFRCIVPVPGQEAVGRQFEAEGDDDLHAAESALRRVALWQATEKLKD